MEHIAIEGHFPHIGPHIADTRLGHALLDQRQLLLGHHHMKMDGAAAFLCHRSSRSRLRLVRGGSFTLSSALSRSGGSAGIGVPNTPQSRFTSRSAKSCSCFLSIIVLLSVAPVRGFLFGCVRGPLLLGFPLGCFQLFGNRAGPAAPFPAQLGNNWGGTELIVRRLLFCQRFGVGQMAPGQERAALYRDALIVVDNFIRGIVGRFRECPDVHRALGGIILVKAGSLDLYDLDLVKPLVVLHPVCKVLFHSVQIVAIVPPFILPLALFVIVAGPRYIGGWGRGMMPQGKAPAIFQHNSFQNGIALIFVHCTSFPGSGNFWTKRPEVPR